MNKTLRRKPEWQVAENLCKARAENSSMPGRCQIYRKIEDFAEIAQLVEHQLPKLRVASSNLVFRSFRPLHPMDAAVSVYNG